MFVHQPAFGPIDERENLTQLKSPAESTHPLGNIQNSQKSANSIKKSGTTIKKSGTTIKKSGTTIKKSGTTIKKSGTTIKKSAQ